MEGEASGFALHLFNFAGKRQGLPFGSPVSVSGDWQNSALIQLENPAYFAALALACLLRVEIPSTARTTARMTSSTPRIA